MRTSGGSRGSSGEWQKPFWQQRGWLISAAFLLSMFLIGGFVLLTGEDSSSNTGQPQPSTPKASGSSSATPSAAPSGSTESRPAGCSTNDADQNVPNQSPADVQWKTYQTDLLPASPSAGPLKVDGPVWSCFAHTPLGSVMALHAIGPKLGGSDWKTVTEKQLAKGPGKDQFVAKRSKVADKNKTGAPGSNASYLGFKILTYSKDQVTTMLLLRSADGSYGAVTESVVWEDGDWKLRPTLTGSVTESMTAVGGPEGFVLWGGSSGS
ncbi:hypothetical protein OOK31_14035 [Streptomyces sp. NBC_00249]|uniref:hypothetical protein n=1 Tax=Streptomyces sp. NBC_00249 TaxID=2975690 RepID=UPI002252C3CC|nr:hypothetical protein [Streptomyces sp. NBC_00249]MCX5195010.1 hypothetical protein [Streptomyces sp. NBC_00249]